MNETYPMPQDQVSMADFHNFCVALREGSLIEAIKIHRRVTGYGLKESKHVVDDIMAGCHAFSLRRNGVYGDADNSGQWVTLRVEDSCTFYSRDAAITDARSSVTAHGWWYVAKVTDVAKCEVTVVKVPQ